MNRLRSNQIFAILLVSAAFPLLCRTDAFTIEGIFGAAIAAVVQLLLCLPMLRLYHTGFSFCDYARKHRILPLFFLAYLLIQGGISFVRLQSTSQDIPGGGSDCPGLPVHRFTGHPGAGTEQHCDTGNPDSHIDSHVHWCDSAGRTAEPFPFAGRHHLAWLSAQHDPCGRIAAAVSAAGFHQKKTIPTYHPHLGRNVSDGRIPFRPRHGSLLVFEMLCVLRITLFTVLAAHLLRLCFPKLRYTSTVCLLLMLGISWGASAVTVPDFVSLAFLGILVLLIPGLLLFLPERRRQAT